MKTERLPRVSVVVPTYGRPALLRRCLDALVRQSMPAGDYEIVVVDDGRSDETRRVAYLAGSDSAQMSQSMITPIVRYTRPPAGKRGPAAARNAGWHTARAATIAFTDDDTIPDAQWLTEGLAAMALHAQCEVSAAAGHIAVPLPPNPTDWDLNTAGLDGAEFATANCFVRRTALEIVGGFDERFRRPWREDSDLYFALMEHGLCVERAPRALVVHPVRDAPWGASIKAQQNVFFEALLFKKYPRLYRSKISGGPPLGYYFSAAALCLAAAAAIADAPLAASGAAAAWSIWTAGFACRRLEETSRSASHVLEMIVTSAIIPPHAVFWRLAGALRFKVLFA
jgi:glycosyltransferase involved in cell wall biosynthesis